MSVCMHAYSLTRVMLLNLANRIYSLKSLALPTMYNSRRYHCAHKHMHAYKYEYTVV